MLSSKDLLEKYEYLTGEDLEHKPSVFEKVKFEYSPLGMVLINKTKSKTNKNKAYNENKQDKYLIYNSQHSFVKFRDIGEFNELLLDSMYKKLNDFKGRFNRLNTVNPQTDNNEVLKQKVLDDVGYLFNKLYYIYKDKYSEEKDGLNARNKKNLLMIISANLKKKKNRRLAKKNHLKNLIKNNHLKNQQKLI